jgi:glycosyltransferase involved in cell wall biosynthesis
VLVVDDGSSDGTGALLAARPDLYTRLVSLPVNGGKGAAVLAGLLQASGDYILFQDADLEYDPNDYALLLQPVIRFEADLVMGTRLRASQITRVSYFWHYVGNKTLTLLFNLLFNTTFTDIYSCYLLYRRTLLDPEQLRSRGWEQQAEILGIVVRNAKAIYEVPINYYGRTYAEGKKIRSQHAVAVAAMIVKMRFRSKRGNRLERDDG